LSFVGVSDGNGRFGCVLYKARVLKTWKGGKLS